MGITSTFPRAQALFKRTCVLPGRGQKRKEMIRGWDGLRRSGFVKDSSCRGLGFIISQFSIIFICSLEWRSVILTSTASKEW